MDLCHTWRLTILLSKTYLLLAFLSSTSTYENPIQLCSALVSPSAHQAGFPTKPRADPTPSQILPSTHFLFRKYGRPKNVSTFPTNGTRDRHILIYSLELKVTALAASPNQAHTVTARHHVSIQTIRLALPAEFNVSGVVVTVITQSYDTKRRIVSLTTTSWPQ